MIHRHTVPMYMGKPVTWCCSYCKSDVTTDREFCQNCGAPDEEQVRFKVLTEFSLITMNLRHFGTLDCI